MADANPNNGQQPEPNQEPDVDIEDDDDTDDDEDVDMDGDDEEYHMAREDVPAARARVLVAAGGNGVAPVVMRGSRVIVGRDPGPHSVEDVHRILSRYAMMAEFAGRRFIRNFRVLSVRHLYTRDVQTLENGGKVILPPSALEQLSQNSRSMLSPMMFKATNPASQQFTHCGVLEFTADDGLCYMPVWMMEMLGLRDNDEIRIEREELPVATFAKFQPQSTDFLDISNPKAVLEASLRFFACLTKGDIVAINYNSQVYRLLVLELLPSDAVSIIECDMNVDFAPPVGYVSPSNSADAVEDDADGAGVASSFVPFAGTGNRLNGKDNKNEPVIRNVVKLPRGQPDTEWRLGTLNFTRKTFRKPEDKKPADDSSKFVPFQGAGNSLRR